MRIALLLLLSVLNFSPAFAELGLEGVRVEPAMQHRINAAQKEFTARIKKARQSGNIQEVKYLFNLDGVSNSGVQEMGPIFEAILNSTKEFEFKKIASSFKGNKKIGGSIYKTTLPRNALIGIATLSLKKQSFSLYMEFAVGEENGKLYFSPFLIPVN